MASITLGKSILSLIALVTIAGPYIADWNETHVLNPNWPPHARFHNGQTMSTGLMLGLCIFYYLYKPIPSGALRSYAAHSNVNIVLLFIHIYYVPSLSGGLYPGALFMDPEFGEGKPQLYGFSALLGIAWVAWAVEKRRLAGEHVKVL